MRPKTSLASLASLALKYKNAMQGIQVESRVLVFSALIY